MSPRYRVTLTNEEIKELQLLTRNGKTPAKKFTNARAMFLSDAQPCGPGWKVADIAAALGVTS